MTDVHNPENRRKNMQAIRGKNTSPEMQVRKLLFARGLRFRLHDKLLPGVPDIVFPRYRTVVLVQGCFWHGHDCHLFKVPQTRAEFWLAKIGSNRERDNRNIQALAEQGWRVISIWECALKGRFRQDTALLGDTIAALIRSQDTSERFIELRHLPIP